MLVAAQFLEGSIYVAYFGVAGVFLSGFVCLLLLLLLWFFWGFVFVCLGMGVLGRGAGELVKINMFCLYLFSYLYPLKV